MRCLRLLVALLIPAAVEASVPDESALEWFAVRQRELRGLLADPRETQVRVGYLHSESGRAYLDVGFGGHLGIVRKPIEGGSMSLMARGLITSRFQIASVSFDQHNSDFIGGIAASYRKNDDAFELYLSHQSSHLGDDLIAQGARAPINYSFESIRLLYSRNLSTTLRVYVGPDVKLRAEPGSLVGKLTFISGADWRFVPSLSALYTAIDIRLRQEADWFPNVTWVLGYELGGDTLTISRQRLFLEIFRGYSHLGQFSTQRELYAMLGLGFIL